MNKDKEDINDDEESKPKEEDEKEEIKNNGRTAKEMWEDTFRYIR